MCFVKILAAVAGQLAEHRTVRHVMAVDQPVGGGGVGIDGAVLVHEQRAAGGVKPVKAAAQVVLVVAGGLHHGQVDVSAVDGQPSDEVGVLLVEVAVGRQYLLDVGSRGCRSRGGVSGIVGIQCGGQGVAGGSHRLHRDAAAAGVFCRFHQRRGGDRLYRSFRLAAAAYSLAQKQSSSCPQQHRTSDAQGADLPPLAGPHAGARRKGIIGRVAPQFAVMPRHSFASSPFKIHRPRQTYADDAYA